MATFRMNKKTTSTSTCTPEQLTEAIRKKAQEIYEKSGRKPGRDVENWLEAERIVKSKKCSC
ncbi:MAG: DUF2934 domain-containing protein [Candidatus Omnitrophica bacterium]|nr:DUF2934 domain-containing protein [Candidatus Omnitrophota bacterium]MDD5436809.1 DUF2934 domain-containing protein [Candidatus Omnitrophota bacterium]